MMISFLAFVFKFCQPNLSSWVIHKTYRHNAHKQPPHTHTLILIFIFEFLQLIPMQGINILRKRFNWKELASLGLYENDSKRKEL